MAWPPHLHLLEHRVALSVLGVAAVLAATAVVLWVRRRKPTAEELERKRRDFLIARGRIMDGSVLDIADVAGPDESTPHRRFVHYEYELAGVRYECSQEVTHLSGEMQQATSAPGFPVSVRYDPKNPFNSIVIAESWNGLCYNPLSAAWLRSGRANLGNT